MAAAHVVTSGPAGGANGNVTTGVDSTGANFITEHCTYFNPAGAPTIGDSKGNSYTSLTISASGNICHVIRYCESPVVGVGHTHTISRTGSFGVIGAMAFSGIDSGAFDKQSTANSASATSLATGSVTPAADNQLLVSSGTCNATGTYSVDSSFTLTGQLNFSSGVNYGLAMGYKIQTTLGAENPTWSTDGAATVMTANIATFDSAAAAAAFAQLLTLLGVG